MTLEEAYTVLGITESSTLEELLEAYRAKAKQCHPDINHSEDATHMMQLVNEAFTLIRSHSETETSFDTAQDDEEEETESEDYENEKAKQPFQGTDATFQEDIFYKVELPLWGNRMYVPKFCPVCMKYTEHVVTGECRFVYSERISRRKVRYTTLTSRIPFHCCCESDLKKYVQCSRDYGTIYFYFKNESYAEYFAQINNAECIRMTKAEKQADVIKRDTKQYGPGCLGGLILGVIAFLMFYFGFKGV